MVVMMMMMVMEMVAIMIKTMMVVVMVVVIIFPFVYSCWQPQRWYLFSQGAVRDWRRQRPASAVRPLGCPLARFLAANHTRPASVLHAACAAHAAHPNRGPVLAWCTVWLGYVPLPPAATAVAPPSSQCLSQALLLRGRGGCLAEPGRGSALAKQILKSGAYERAAP